MTGNGGEGERSGGGAGRREPGREGAQAPLPARPPAPVAPTPPPAAGPVGTPLPEEVAAVPTESRTFETADGDRWSVEVAGRDRTGTPPDGGAPLLLLRFRRLASGGEPSTAPGTGETPPPARGDDPSLESLVVGGDLAFLADRELEGVLASARPPRPSVSK